VPQAIASIIGKPKPSERLANSQASHLLYKSLS
jgi:hypothetical protein